MVKGFGVWRKKLWQAVVVVSFGRAWAKMPLILPYIPFACSAQSEIQASAWVTCVGRGC